jgi:hypothetical protein
MIRKCIKIGVVGLVLATLTGALLFGKDLLSYASSTAKAIRTSAKEAVPLDFELARAKDLLEGIIPEMQANVRVIATEEVEVASLESDIQKGQQSMEQERTRLARLADAMGIQQASYTIGGRDYTRQQVKEDLARRFDRFKEAESVMESKKRLLESRKGSLLAAVRLLEQASTGWCRPPRRARGSRWTTPSSPRPRSSSARSRSVWTWPSGCWPTRRRSSRRSRWTW